MHIILICAMKLFLFIGTQILERYENCYIAKYFFKLSAYFYNSIQIRLIDCRGMNIINSD